jgi:hypothetical protein
MWKVLKCQLCLVIALCAAGGAAADELSDAMENLCGKMKECARESMQGQQIPDNMKEMVDSILEQSCASLRESYGAAAQHHELYKPAVACMDSLHGVTCAEIQEHGQGATSECAAFEQEAKNYENKGG